MYNKLDSGVIKSNRINVLDGKVIENKVIQIDDRKAYYEYSCMRILDDLESRVQNMRENGETDLRSVLNLISIAKLEINQI